MTTYTATIRHHSIIRAAIIECGDNPSTALYIADEEFGDGFLDHEIVVFAHAENNELEPELFASRIIHEPKWTITP